MAIFGRTFLALVMSSLLALAVIVGHIPQLGLVAGVVVLSIGQIGGLVVCYWCHKNLTVRFLMTYVAMACVSWALAAPNLLKNSRHVSAAKILRALSAEVFCSTSSGPLLRKLPPLRKWGLVGTTEVLDVRIQQHVKEEDFQRSLDLLRLIAFGGKLTVERDVVTDQHVAIVARIDNLSGLAVIANRGPSSVGVRDLGRLKRLEELELVCSGSATELEAPKWNVNDDDFDGFVALKRLEISRLDLNGSFLSRLRNLPVLQQLNLHHTNFDDRAVYLLRGANLRGLTLIDCPITNAAMIEIVRLPELKSLKITSMMIDEKGASKLLLCEKDDFYTLEFVAAITPRYAALIRNHFRGGSKDRHVVIESLPGRL